MSEGNRDNKLPLDALVTLGLADLDSDGRITGINGLKLSSGGADYVLVDSGDLIFQTNGTERARIKTDGTATGAFSGLPVATFSQSGDATTGTGTGRYPLSVACTLSKVLVTVDTAPVGADLILDVNKNGTTIFTTQANRPTVAAGTHQASAVPDVTDIAANDYLTVDIDQIGTTTPGANIVVVVVFSG